MMAPVDQRPSAGARSRSGAGIASNAVRSTERSGQGSQAVHVSEGACAIVPKHPQEGTLDVTPWMEWFLACLGRAIDGAQTTLASVLKKARFWQTVRDVPINGRQRLVLNRVLDGFEGKLTTSKWVTIAKCSSDTALRDIVDLVERGVLVRNPGAGRNTSYSLAEVR